MKSRSTELSVLVAGPLVVLAFLGTSAQGQGLAIFAKDASSIKDTALAYDAPPIQPADIGSVFANASGEGSSHSPMPTADATVMQGSTIVALAPPDTAYLDGFKAYQIVEYTVQSGDTIGSIASNFGVSVDTIVWANSLKNPNALSLGQVLKIPPVSGVVHTVQAGDTVVSIAQKYKADSAKIVSFNDLNDGQILQAGEEIMVPDGELPGPKPSVRSLGKGSGSSGIYVPVGDGQCVAFVQAHGFSHMSGNAITWKRYINTPIPVVGGVVVLRGGRYGHVALITAIKADSIQIVEQNYYGLYIIDHREISLEDRAIVGFIQ